MQVLEPWVYTINPREEKLYLGEERRIHMMYMEQIRRMEEIYFLMRYKSWYAVGKFN